MPQDPRDPVYIDPYRATPQSIAHAKAAAALERALAADAVRGAEERVTRATLERLITAHGAAHVIALVQSVADRLEADRSPDPAAGEAAARELVERLGLPPLE